MSSKGSSSSVGRPARYDATASRTSWLRVWPCLLARRFARSSRGRSRSIVVRTMTCSYRACIAMQSVDAQHHRSSRLLSTGTTRARLHRGQHRLDRVGELPVRDVVVRRLRRRQDGGARTAAPGQRQHLVDRARPRATCRRRRTDRRSPRRAARGRGPPAPATGRTRWSPASTAPPHGAARHRLALLPGTLRHGTRLAPAAAQALDRRVGAVDVHQALRPGSRCARAGRRRSA